MSGGPVINNTNGRLCGVICRSLEGENPYTYVASIWRIMDLTFHVEVKNNIISLDDGKYSLRDMVQKGIIDAINLDACDQYFEEYIK